MPDDTKTPEPTLMQPERYIPYEHWECPDGYKLDYYSAFWPFQKDRVRCQSNADVDRDMQSFELQHVPVGSE